jgi:GAF domain-containing protein
LTPHAKVTEPARTKGSPEIFARCKRENLMRENGHVSDLAALQEETAELRLERERAEERAAAARDVIQTIARSRFDLDAVLQTVIDRAVSLCDADTGNIARREGDKDEYRVAAFTAMSPEYERLVRARVNTAERGSIIGPTVLEQRVVHIDDVIEDQEYALPELQKVAGFRTALGVPMLRESVPIGAIAVARNEVRPFSDAEIRLVETFAGYVVVAIENVRLFQTVERQRTELARFAPQAANLLSSDEGEQLLAGHRREITASAIFAASPRSPRRRSRRRYSACCASTTPWPASSLRPTRGRSSTSQATHLPQIGRPCKCVLSTDVDDMPGSVGELARVLESGARLALASSIRSTPATTSTASIPRTTSC